MKFCYKYGFNPCHTWRGSSISMQSSVTSPPASTTRLNKSITSYSTSEMSLGKQSLKREKCWGLKLSPYLKFTNEYDNDLLNL